MAVPFEMPLRKHRPQAGRIASARAKSEKGSDVRGDDVVGGYEFGFWVSSLEMWPPVSAASGKLHGAGHRPGALIGRAAVLERHLQRVCSRGLRGPEVHPSPRGWREFCGEQRLREP